MYICTVALRNKRQSHMHLTCTYADTHMQIRIRTYTHTHTHIRSSLLFIALEFHCVVLLEKTNELSLRENYKIALVDQVVRNLHIVKQAIVF